MDKQIDLVQFVQQLYLNTKHRMPSYPWFSEQDRWAELAFCLLDRVHPNQEGAVRAAVVLLQQLNLLNVKKLAEDDVEWPTEEYPYVIPYVLRQQGFTEEEAKRGVTVLANAAQIIQMNYNGRIQTFLRKHGEAMRNELIETFGGLDLDDQDLRFAMSQWLQSALYLPISAEHESLVAFLEKNNLSKDELTEAIDKVGLNVAYVDRLIALSTPMKRAVSQNKDELEAQE
jgi:hypothetical protein